MSTYPRSQELQAKAIHRNPRPNYGSKGGQILGKATLDLLHLIEVLAEWNPVRILNRLVESAPNLDLQHIPEEHPVKVLEAVLKTLLTNDRLLLPPKL